MELSLKGRVALVSGASKGVGKGVARALAAEGVNLVLLARGAAELEDAAREIADESGVQVLPVSADVTQRDDVHRAGVEARERFGTVHIVVNNAGAAIQRRDREIMWDDDDWQKLVEIKSLGALRVIREFLPLMPNDGTGRIVNITGASGVMTWMPALTYGLNNAALIHVTGYLAADLASQKITVNTVVPGLVGTEWRQEWARSMANQAGKPVDEWLRDFCISKGILSGRWAEVEEVGSMVTYLASDQARYINGARFAVDGGLTANVR
ncbi:SDR family oxidoreductase [Paraburkholderia sp. A3BS-1L]|uniref:SDR family NAD(P)-dependent oxidoreductase n=1 Tax=Paraburkholderia sp. A3BS-1L TaxID=3028375 RepID=UPI003DA88EAD